jgi:soluble lytic murein transglycosylase-like protein
MSIDTVMARVRALSTQLAPATNEQPLGAPHVASADSSAARTNTAFDQSYHQALQSSDSSATSPDSSLDWSTPGDAVPVGTPYADVFTTAAEHNGLSPKLLAAVADVETHFHTGETSSAGAEGIMQFMPQTADAMGVNTADPASSIDGAARLLSGHLQHFGSIEAALAAYNQGSGTVERAGGTVPATARDYVNKVMSRVQGGTR